MLRKPNTFKKYHDALETQAASSEASSTPRCSIGLKRNVNGNGTFVVTNPENIQFIQPPMITMGRTLMKFPLTMSDSMADELGLTGCRFWVLKYPASALLKKCRRIANDWAVRYLPFSRSKRARIIAWLQKHEFYIKNNDWEKSQAIKFSWKSKLPVLDLCELNFFLWWNQYWCIVPYDSNQKCDHYDGQKHPNTNIWID